jgi:hypothetical protein
MTLECSLLNHDQPHEISANAITTLRLVSKITDRVALLRRIAVHGTAPFRRCCTAA